jgi:hypothetical protein
MPDEIGIWIVRIMLVAGAIIGGLKGEYDVVGGCIVAILITTPL